MITVANLEQAEVEIKRLIKEVYVDERGKADPIFDGVVKINRYVLCPTRMLWILKEPWDGPDSSGGGWSLVSNSLAIWPVSDLSQSTFHPIIYITNGILKEVWDYNAMPWI